ncbi:MAG: tripartite tricarboxylate transporter substrate-binding protein [Burkholderiaceae bacterium]
MHPTRRTFIAASAAAALPAPFLAFGQGATVIQKPARIVLGFPAGGSLDTIARLLAERLKGTYAPVVTVENRAGAAGRIAMDAVKASEPDGTMITMGPASVAVLYPHVYKRLSYDPVKDFSPVSTVCIFQFGFTLGPMVPAGVRTPQQFAQWCKANPKDASFGSPGEGTMAHFAGIMISRALGLEMQHVPFKGGAPALQAVVGGQIAASINVLVEPLPFIKDGKLRALGVTGPARAAYLPDVPTFVEQGFREVEVQEYFAAWLAPKTPAPIVEGLAAQLRRAIQTRELEDAYAARAFAPSHTSPQELDRMIRADIERWGPVVRSTGFTIDS